MGRFITELDVRVLGNRNFKLLQPLTYIDTEGNLYTVPKGTKTDFASVWKVPIASTLLAGKCNKEATLHDYFYKTGCITRKEADLIFREAIISNEENWLFYKRKVVANVIYIFVRLFAGFAYQNRKEANEK